MMFTHVIMLPDNQRVKASNEQQNVFQNLLSHLCNSDSTEEDWRLLLTRRHSQQINWMNLKLPFDYFAAMKICSSI